MIEAGVRESPARPPLIAAARSPVLRLQIRFSMQYTTQYDTHTHKTQRLTDNQTDILTHYLTYTTNTPALTRHTPPLGVACVEIDRQIRRTFSLTIPHALQTHLHMQRPRR